MLYRALQSGIHAGAFRKRDDIWTGPDVGFLWRDDWFEVVLEDGVKEIRDAAGHVVGKEMTYKRFEMPIREVSERQLGNLETARVEPTPIRPAPPPPHSQAAIAARSK